MFFCGISNFSILSLLLFSRYGCRIRNRIRGFFPEFVQIWIRGGKSSESVRWTYWGTVTHALTCAQLIQYSAVYRFRSLPSADFFAAVSDSFGLSVCESVFIYHVEVFKRRCVIQRLLAAVIILSVAVVIGKCGLGQWHYDHWSVGQQAVPHCWSVIGKGSA